MTAPTRSVVELGRIPSGGEALLPALWRSREVRWSACSGLLIAAFFLAGIAGAPQVVVTAGFVLAAVVGARFFAVEAVEELVEEREIGIELLMTVALVVAGLLGEWGEAAMLAFLYSIAESLEEFTEDRTRDAIRKLLDLAPRRVTLLTAGGTEREVDVDQLEIGDRFLVRPGQNVATDGKVLEGRSAVDEAAVTGESVPVDKQPGDSVFAGTANASGALVVEATATSQTNTLARVVELVTAAQQQKGGGQRFMERFARVYSPAVLATGVLVLVGGGLVTGAWHEWALRAATVLVAAAPCALVISIPVTYVAAMGRSSRSGVLIKGGVYLEELGRLRAVALDKTGTLTHGTPQLTGLHTLRGTEEAQLLALAAAAERRSEHPIARAIVAAAEQRGLRLPEVERFEAAVGAGVHATVDGTDLTVGSPTYLTSHGHDMTTAADTIEERESAGNTVVVLADPNGPLGVLAVADTLRPQARDTVAELRRLGIEHIAMLTGDNERTAAAIARQAGIDDIAAGRTPEGKADHIRQLVERYDHVAMVGDGINDAPPLAAATVGIAMGTAGSDIALETADVALMADDLTKLTTAIRTGRRTRRVVAQNLGLSLTILAVLVPAALAGTIGLAAAVLAHELSELAVILNGTRMARR
ncbi:MAG: heavy metal translocating P-type ATPase [Actinobacteria bacterium]|jgi:Cd2+/Zn2+-exporting ATPase|nr:heavy metal translocating P-type ATPase [Actinomycetota bacterium]